MFLVPMTRHAHDLARQVDRVFDDRFFDRLFTPADGESTPRSPAMDVRESEQAYTVLMDLPGVAKEDVKVQIEGRRVLVSAEQRPAIGGAQGERVLYRERSAGAFSRSFTLPQDIDQATSEARMEAGVLTLSLAKRSASSAQSLPVR